MQAVALPRHRLVAERRGKVEWKQSSDFFFPPPVSSLASVTSMSLSFLRYLLPGFLKEWTFLS